MCLPTNPGKLGQAEQARGHRRPLGGRPVRRGKELFWAAEGVTSAVDFTCLFSGPSRNVWPVGLPAPDHGALCGHGIILGRIEPSYSPKPLPSWVGSGALELTRRPHSLVMLGKHSTVIVPYSYRPRNRRNDGVGNSRRSHAMLTISESNRVRTRRISLTSTVA